MVVPSVPEFADGALVVSAATMFYFILKMKKAHKKEKEEKEVGDTAVFAT